MKLSTYCGSFSQRQFKQHISECEVCWQDAQGRFDLEFDPSVVTEPIKVKLGASATPDHHATVLP